MGLFELVDRWITERASAASLRGQLEFEKSHVTNLERRLKEAETAKVDLEAENAELRAEVESLRSEIDQIRRHQKQDDGQRDQQLAKVAEGGDERGQVLHYVSIREGCEAADIAAVYEMAEQRATWHLEELAKAKLVQDLWLAAGWDRPRALRTWCVTAAGRDALVRLKLL